MYISINKLRHLNDSSNCYDLITPVKELIGSGIIDKLEVLIDGINMDYINRRHRIIGRPKQNDHYKRVAKYMSRYANNDEKFSLSHNPDEPKEFFSHYYSYKLTLNPGNFKNMKRLQQFLKQVCKGSLRHKIYRIDFAVVLPLKYFSPTFIFEHVYFPYQQVARRYKSDEVICEKGTISGFNIGSSSSVLSCYDIAKKIEKKKHYKKITKYQSEKAKTIDRKATLTKYGAQVINIEIQLRKDMPFKYGLREISDLTRVKDISPFDMLEFYDFYSIDYQDKKNEEKLINFIFNAKTYGFHTARRSFNSNNNVGRIIKTVPILRLGREQKTLNYILKKSFKRGMKKYLSTD